MSCVYYIYIYIQSEVNIQGYKVKLNLYVYLHLSSSTSFLIYKKSKHLEFGKGLFGRLSLFAGGL